MTDRYRLYSKYLKDHYGEKVYKLPIKLKLTCPNRDGRIGCGGCIYCSEEGGSFENNPADMPIREQLEKDKAKMEQKYNAHKFIAYFQSYSNTYMPIDAFRDAIREASGFEGLVGISVSTRPDCINKAHLDILKEVADEYNLDIIIELGLQTANNKTLRIINRQHGVSDFVRASLLIKEYGFRICAHVILALPWDEREDVIETAKLLTVLGVDEVKIHSLYIPKNTRLALMYEKGEVKLKSLDDYIDEVILFLSYLGKDILVQRLVGRMPEKNTVFCNWSTSHWKIQKMILGKMEEEDISQGCKSSYIWGIMV
ncbi:MAG: TIGR01212 family radical SAM protein [Finegoldia sp.]|nr:TIGR01212 family radical SAM protein [Finegoldia sp.]